MLMFYKLWSLECWW